MTAASEIIARLGGFKAVAEMLGITRNGVQRWTYGRNQGGLENRVPAKHWAALIEKSEGKVTLAELMNAELAQAVQASEAA
jgi:DNA-binding transcriptional regulator YdaS (Cro superfamily)